MGERTTQMSGGFPQTGTPSAVPLPRLRSLTLDAQSHRYPLRVDSWLGEQFPENPLTIKPPY